MSGKPIQLAPWTVRPFLGKIPRHPGYIFLLICLTLPVSECQCLGRQVLLRSYCQSLWRSQRLFWGYWNWLVHCSSYWANRVSHANLSHKDSDSLQIFAVLIRSRPCFSIMMGGNSEHRLAKFAVLVKFRAWCGLTTTGDVIGCGLDADLGKVDYWINGKHLGTAVTGLAKREGEERQSYCPIIDVNVKKSGDADLNFTGPF